MNSEVAEAPEHVFDPYFLRDVKQGQTIIFLAVVNNASSKAHQQTSGLH